MSTIKTNNAQIGQSVTATNNFTWYQPASPDGTVRLGVGNSGATSLDAVTINSSGNLGLGVTPSAWQSAQRAIEFGYAGSSLAANNTNGNINFSINRYINTSGTNTYANNGYAASYQLINDGSHRWLTAPSGTAGAAIGFTQAMTLDASGNLGIGTSSPSVKLNVDSGASGEYARFNSTNASGGFLRLTNSGTSIAYIGAAGQTISGGSASDFGITSANNLVFGTGASFFERMRIDSSGNLLVGTTSSTGFPTQTTGGGSCYVLGTYFSRSAAAASGKYWAAGCDNSANYIVYAQGTTGVYMVNGATAWTANSDERLKTELTPFENAAEKILSLRAGTGRYLTDDESVSRSFLIAQDVQKVLPEAVNIQDDEQGTLGLQYTDVIPLLVAAIKELKTELDATKAEVAALKGA